MLASPAGLEAFLETAGQLSIDEKGRIFEELRVPLCNFVEALEAKCAPTKELREILGDDEKVGRYSIVRSALLHQSAAALMKLSSKSDRYRTAADQVIWKNNYVTKLETPPGKRKNYLRRSEKWKTDCDQKKPPNTKGPVCH